MLNFTDKYANTDFCVCASACIKCMRYTCVHTCWGWRMPPSAVVSQVPYPFCFCLSVYCFETGSFTVLELTKYARLAGQWALDPSVSTSAEMEFQAHIIHPGFLYMDSGTELRPLCQIKPSHQSQKHEFVYLVLGLFVCFETGSNYVALVLLELTM